MKSKLYISIILLSLFFSVYEKANAQAPGWLWAKAIGSETYDYCHSITLDPTGSGDVYITGSYSGTVDCDPGVGIFNLTGHGIFVTKLNGSGNFVWAKKALDGVFGWVAALSIVLDPSGTGDICIIGRFWGTFDFDPDSSGIFNLTSTAGTAINYDIFISKLDGAGNFVWAKAIGGTSDDVGYSIALDPSGNGDVYIAGFFGETVDFDPGAGIFNLTSVTATFPDIFISKLDGSGNFVWAKAMGGAYEDYAYSIAVDPGGSGDVCITGYFKQSVDFDPGGGTFILTSAGYEDIFVSKLDVLGNFIWAKAIGGGAWDGGLSLALDQTGSGDVFTTGYFVGTVDFDPGTGVFNLASTGTLAIYISKLDNSGNFVWAKAMSGTEDVVGYSMALDPSGSGDIYTTGVFNDTADFDPGAGTFNLTPAGGADVFISKLDNSGNFVWAKAVGGAESDLAHSIAVDASGQVYLAGYFDSPFFSFGSTTLANVDNTGITMDIFIAKLDNVITGIESVENNNEISVYPNPASELLVISYPLSGNKKATITINDIAGQLIYKTTSANTQQVEVNTKDFVQGVYVVRIEGADFIETKKFIVSK